MTDNEIKECLSEGFIRIILAQSKFKVYDPKYDHGVDLSVCPVEKIELPNGDIMYQDSDRRMDIQLKCTTTKYAKEKDNFIHYNLRNKNFLTLKSKVNSQLVKMILVLLVLPEDPNTWIKVVNDEMLFKKQCFWYIPEDSNIPPDIRMKGKDDYVKILIPNTNHLLSDFENIYKTVNNL